MDLEQTFPKSKGSQRKLLCFFIIELNSAFFARGNAILSKSPVPQCGGGVWVKQKTTNFASFWDERVRETDIRILKIHDKCSKRSRQDCLAYVIYKLQNIKAIQLLNWRACWYAGTVTWGSQLYSGLAMIRGRACWYSRYGSARRWLFLVSAGVWNLVQCKSQWSQVGTEAIGEQSRASGQFNYEISLCWTWLVNPPWEYGIVCLVHRLWGEVGHKEGF